LTPLLVVASFAILIAAIVMTPARQVDAQAVAVPITWDYTSVGVDLSSLPARLTELGNDSWEVVSVLSTDAAVEQQADGKAHVVGQRVEVVAKRPRKR
jgi:hypothetical protein